MSKIRKKNTGKPTKWALFAAIAFIVGMAALSYSVLFGHSVEERLETVVVLREMGRYTDLPNKNEGTVVVSLRATDQDVNVGGYPTRVQIFRSRMVEGLAIDYLYDEKRLAAGLPSLRSESFELLDGKMHEVAYTFKTGGKQMLFVDGQKVAEGDYSPANPLSVTGFAIKAPESEVRAELDQGFEIYNRALSEEEIMAKTTPSADSSGLEN